MAKEGGKPRLDRKTWFALWNAAEFVKNPEKFIVFETFAD